MLLDNFMESMATSMESNSNASTSTINNSRNSNSHKGGNMETASNNSNASNSNSKGNGKHNSNSKRNSNSKGNGKANSKASAPNASNSNAPTLPDTMPATANAGISVKGMEQDAATSLLFQYHIRQGLAAYGGACSICQLYNFLRGDNPLRLEKDGSPKQDNLPRWRGLGSSKLFRANTQGTLLEYTNKVCANGRIRSIVKAGPMLQEFPSK